MSIEFPLLYDDELLTSGWARYCDRMSYSRLSYVFEDLFGTAYVAQMSDLPMRIGDFAQRLPHGYPCTTEELLQQHTFFPYHAPFLTPGKFRTVADAMMTLHHGKRIGNVLDVRHTPWKRMRYCPECVVFDRAHTKERECYWHRIHQAPGVFICPQHHTWLEESNVPSRGTAAAFVSAEKAGLTLEPRNATTSTWNKQLEAISRESASLLSIPGSTHNGESFSRNVWPYLHSRSYIIFSATRGEMVRAALLAYDLFQHYSADILQLMGWYPHEITSKLRHQLSEILRHKQYSSEPFLLPLLAILVSCYFEVPISELFQESSSIALTNNAKSASVVVDGPPWPSPPAPPLPAQGREGEPQRPQRNRYDAIARESAGPKRWPCVNPLCEYYQIPSESVRLQDTCWKNSDNSVNHYRCIFRLTCACGCRWSVRRHNAIKEAPDRTTVIDYGELWRAELCRLWDDHSLSINRIAERLHVTHNTVTNHARKLGLAMPRNEQQRKRFPANADFLARRRRQRELLKEFLKHHPSANRASLRRIHRNLYDWFITWDRSWFDQCLPLQSCRTSPRRPRRTMKVRLATITTVSVVSEDVLNMRLGIQTPGDTELAQRVRSTALQMVEEGSVLRICWATLRQRIPELSITLWQLRKLPLTHAAVRDVTETADAATVRRIYLLARQWRAQGQRITKMGLLQYSSTSYYKHPMVQRALQTVLEGQFE